MLTLTNGTVGIEWVPSGLAGRDPCSSALRTAQGEPRHQPVTRSPAPNCRHLSRVDRHANLPPTGSLLFFSSFLVFSYPFPFSFTNSKFTLLTTRRPPCRQKWATSERKVSQTPRLPRQHGTAPSPGASRSSRARRGLNRRGGFYKMRRCRAPRESGKPSSSRARACQRATSKSC